MGDDKEPGLRYTLWKYRVVIILVLAVVILAASTYYFYRQSYDRAAALDQKSSEYDALNVSYYTLTGEHATLIASNNNMSERYDDLNYTYKSLLENDSSLRSDYDRLKASVDGFQEKGGSRVALFYKIRRESMPDGPRVFVDATVYNVGDQKIDNVVIKCKFIYEYQPDVDEHIVKDLQPLAKKTITWNYSSYADIDALWI